MSKPMGLEIDPESFLWSQEEIDALKREGFEFVPERMRVARAKYRQKEQNVDRRRASGGAPHDGEGVLSFLRLGPGPSAMEKRGRRKCRGYAQSGLGLGPGFFSWQWIFCE